MAGLLNGQATLPFYGEQSVFVDSPVLVGWISLVAPDANRPNVLLIANVAGIGEAAADEITFQFARVAIGAEGAPEETSTPVPFGPIYQWVINDAIWPGIILVGTDSGPPFGSGYGVLANGVVIDTEAAARCNFIQAFTF